MTKNDIDWSFEDIACEATDTPKELLRVKGRTTDKACTARYLCFMHLTRTTSWSLSKIGKRYYRDHSTVSHGIAKYQDFIDGKDKDFIRAIAYFNKYVKVPELKLIYKDISNDDIRTMNFMYREGVNINKIASFYNTTKKILDSVLIVPDFKPFNDKTKCEIEYFHRKGVSGVELAKRYNTSEVTISRICRNYKNGK